MIFLLYLTIFSSADLVIAVMGDKLPEEASFKVIIIIIIIISFTITSMYIWPIILILFLCYY